MNPAKPKIKIPLFDLKLAPVTIKEVNSVLKSGWLSSGPKVAAFEKGIGKITKVQPVAAVSSGTAGLFLALKALDVKEGDEVITTPFTFVATMEVILHVGATPVLADIDPSSLNISCEEVQRRITDKTKAIVPVDMAGYPADYRGLNKLALAHSLKIISDSAHSFGATYEDKAIPHWTDVTVYSFYSTKNVTSAEGGAVVSRRQELIDKVRLLARHGLTSSAYDRKLSGGWKYDAPILGYKGNMSDVHAAIGLGELSVLENNQEKKRKLAERYVKNLQPVSELIKVPLVGKGYEHAWHLFIGQLELEKLDITRDQFVNEMASCGVECGVHYQPVFELSYYSNFFSLSLKKYPNAARSGQRVVSLPMYPTLKVSDVDRICEAIVEILNSNSR